MGTPGDPEPDLREELAGECLVAGRSVTGPGWAQASGPGALHVAQQAGTGTQAY